MQVRRAVDPQPLPTLADWLLTVRRAAVAASPATLRDVEERGALAADPRRPVAATFAPTLVRAVMEAGGGARGLVAPLVPVLAEDLVRAGPHGGFVRQLGCLSMVLLAESVGLPVPGFSGELARSWLSAMPTAANEDQRYHRERGLGALIWDIPYLARSVAGLTQPRPVQVGAPFGANLQAFQAQVVTAAAEGLGLEPLRPAWHALLRSWPALEQLEAVFRVQLVWYARAVGGVVGGVPADRLADWLRDELDVAAAA